MSIGPHHPPHHPRVMVSVVFLLVIYAVALSLSFSCDVSIIYDSFDDASLPLAFCLPHSHDSPADTPLSVMLELGQFPLVRVRRITSRSLDSVSYPGCEGSLYTGFETRHCIEFHSVISRMLFRV